MELRRSISALLLAGLTGLASPSLAEEPAPSETARAEAQQAHRRALQLFDAGRHAEALAEFQRAYSLAPSFRIRYNIGLSHAALGDSLAAVDAFSAYLREGGDKLPPERRAQVESEIARLTQQLASLSLSVAEPGAEVRVDDELLGQGPLSRRLRLNAGAHRVTVRGADGTTKTESVTLSSGGEQRLSFEAPSRSANAPAPSLPERKEPAKREVPWLAWGITGALGAATAVTGVLALSAHGDESDAQRRRGVTQTELDDARSQVETLGLATDVLLACTVLSAGTSLYLTLRRPAEPQSALRVGPGFVSWQRSF